MYVIVLSGTHCRRGIINMENMQALPICHRNVKVKLTYSLRNSSHNSISALVQRLVLNQGFVSNVTF